MNSSPIGVFVTPVTPLQQNCTTVWCTATNKAAVIDPGGDLERIEEAMNLVRGLG